MNVVAIVSAPRADGPEATEFLRVLAALRALEVPIAVHEVPAIGHRRVVESCLFGWRFLVHQEETAALAPNQRMAFLHAPVPKQGPRYRPQRAGAGASSNDGRGLTPRPARSDSLDNVDGGPDAAFYIQLGVI